jgi:predicted phosphodiesterase
MPSKDYLEDKNILSTIKKWGINSFELNEILKSKITPTKSKFHDHTILGYSKIGIISDTHIGSNKFDENLFALAGKTFRENKVDAVYHAGDILEGMSGRDGNIYELDYMGFSKQIGYAVKLWKKYFKGLKTFAITGNHDLWFKIRNNSGIDAGEELENRLGKDIFEYLGESEANVKLGPKTIMKLFHPNDGTAYTVSYKLQKLIESLESGRKPNILIEGHYHKALYMFYRNIHGLESGTLCGQTEFMRGKKIAAHK